jgi:transcriptional regulator with XRE-family HTH domain
MTEDNDFGRRLTAVRVAYASLTGEPASTRADFAAKLGIEPSRYRRYERGEVQPQMSVLRAIRNLTGISLDWLICGLEPGMDDLALAQLQGPCQATFGERLTYVREVLGHSAADLATRLGVDPVLWSKWESGSEPMPTATIEAIASYLNVSLDYLLRGLPTGLGRTLLRALLDAHPTLWQMVDHGSLTSLHARHPDGRDPASGAPHLPTRLQFPAAELPGSVPSR